MNALADRASYWSVIRWRMRKSIAYGLSKGKLDRAVADLGIADTGLAIPGWCIFVRMDMEGHF